MSWKSFVSAGVLCVLASPVFAAPTVEIVPGGTVASGHLNAAGDWVWNVRLSQSSPPVDIDNMGGAGLPLGSPLAAELGFEEMLSELLSAANLIDGFDTATNPGSGIHPWNVLSDTDGDGNTGTCGVPPCTFGDALRDPDDEPTGVQSNLTLDQVFSALGSVDYLSDVDGKGYIQIVVDGPNSSASLSTTLTMSGSYTGMGRIAELNDAFDPTMPSSPTNPMSLNYDTYSGAVTRQAQAGDADLTGDVDGVDLDAVLQNFFIDDGQRKWFHGDFDGTGDVDGVDLDAVLQNFFAAPYTVFIDPTLGAGGGGGGGGAVPEPATMALMALAALGLAGLRGRRA